MVVLTGASGWFGKNALHTLERRIGPQRLRKELYPVASKAQLIDYGSPLGPIQCYPLESLRELGHTTAVLHTAFLKRGRMNDYGHERFVKANRHITESVIRLIRNTPDCPIVAISSGSASVCDDPLIGPSLEQAPYPVLKHEEEEALRKCANKNMVMVLRVFATSGRFMPLPTPYALGEFIQLAIQRQPIEVHASHPVWRSYVHNGDLMALCWDLLFEPLPPGYHRLDACTDTVEIEMLARQVTACLGGGPVRRRVDRDGKENRYVGDSQSLIELMKYRGIAVKTLKEQVLDSAEDLQGRLRAHLNQNPTRQDHSLR